MKPANDSSSDAVMTDATADDRLTAEDIGKALRVAREQRKLSLEQVSDALHLDEPIIVALEQGRFESLGASVYVRGHLKTYSNLLGLPASEIIRGYQAGLPEPVVAPSLKRSGISPATINPVLMIGAVLAILLGLLLGIYVLFADDELEKTVAELDVDSSRYPASSVQAESSIEDVIEVQGEILIPDQISSEVALPEIVPGTERAEFLADDADVIEPVAKTPESRPVAMMRLVLQFKQESWVEISDANRRLLFGLQREGNRREITGEPPFSLLIGNASGVAMTINDEPFEVPVSRMRGNVARFEIVGDESE